MLTGIRMGMLWNSHHVVSKRLYFRGIVRLAHGGEHTLDSLYEMG
jgi:hypothetical protein